MKKITLVLSGLIILSFGSCNKEEFKPNQDDVERTIIIDNSGDEKSNNNRGAFNPTNQSDTTITITDPNRDEDEDRKAERKK